MKFILTRKKVIPNKQMTIILAATLPLAMTLFFFSMLPYAFGLIIYAVPLTFLAIMIIPYYKINKIREGILMHAIFSVMCYALVPMAIWIGNQMPTDDHTGTIFAGFLIALTLISLITAGGISLRVKRLSEKWNQQFDEYGELR